MTTSANYIQHLHAFRGFAILSVVGAHAWSFMIFWTGGLDVDGLKWLFWLTETVFHGSTIYFAIISGLLFNLVLAEKSWSSFFNSKINHVLFPYLILTFALTGFYWHYVIESGEVANTLSSYLKIASQNLITGKADIHFWYIPVLAFLFLATPLLAWLQRKSNLVFVLIILLPLMVSRSPFPDFIKPQSFVYFLGAYALGMAMGTHYQQVKQFVSERKVWLLATALISSVLLYALYVVDYQPGSLFSVRQTLVYIQKVAICLLVLHWLSALEGSDDMTLGSNLGANSGANSDASTENRIPNWLMSLGTYAFAIFFLHVIFIGTVIQTVRPILDESRSTALIGLFGSISFVAAVLGSIALAYVIKRLLGKHSRKLVGA